MPDDTDARPNDPGDAPTLGELIRRRRRMLGLSQAQVAEVMGVDQSTVARWERGDRISPERLEVLAGWMELPVDTVVKMNFRQIRPQPVSVTGDTADWLVLVEWLARTLARRAGGDEACNAGLAELLTTAELVRPEDDDFISSYSFTDIDELYEHLHAADLLGLGVSIANKVIIDDSADLSVLSWTLELRVQPPVVEI